VGETGKTREFRLIPADSHVDLVGARCIPKGQGNAHGDAERLTGFAA
jgi:hypothetical protein